MTNRGHDVDMVQVARQVLQAAGFAVDVPAALEDASSLPAVAHPRDLRDLRELPWSSIDNAESRDLDQIEVARRDGDGIRVAVGIADVDSLAPLDSPGDRFARQNTTSLYTGVRVFPMLPEILSTDRTSLLPGGERRAVVTALTVMPDGVVTREEVTVARVENHAKLVYEPVGAWLAGDGPGPRDQQIAQQVRLQAEAAGWLRRHRAARGALEIETIEARPVAENGRIVDLVISHKDRAKELVEDLMIAVNGASARFLESRGRSSLRRVVRAPRRWDRIVAIAAERGTHLPAAPDARALAAFLTTRREAAPERFAELSLSIVKLLGPGEYVVQRKDEPDLGHFGLAVDDYAHSTAPNRRYADLVTQRLLKAAAADLPSPYSDAELATIATHCNERQTAARKVERTLRKVAGAVLLAPRVGETFDAVVTGASDKGVYARLRRPSVEGRIVHGERGLDVGDTVRVRLDDVDVARGFVDFAAVTAR